MNTSTRLRQLADRMGLDGFAEELREIAGELEAKAGPAVPQCDLASVTEIETVIDWCVTSYMPMPSNEHAALLVDRLRHLRATPAAPSQPVTLTDDEIGDLARPYGRSSINGFDHIKGFARKVIAALREKQGGV